MSNLKMKAVKPFAFHKYALVECDKLCNTGNISCRYPENPKTSAIGNRAFSPRIKSLLSSFFKGTIVSNF